MKYRQNEMLAAVFFQYIFQTIFVQLIAIVGFILNLSSLFHDFRLMLLLKVI